MEETTWLPDRVSLGFRDWFRVSSDGEHGGDAVMTDRVVDRLKQKARADMVGFDFRSSRDGEDEEHQTREKKNETKEIKK